MDFKDKLNELFRESGSSAYLVSKETKISQGLISDYRNGRSIPKRENVKKLANFFGVTPGYFDSDNPAPPTKKDAPDGAPKIGYEDLTDCQKRLVDIVVKLDNESAQAVTDLIETIISKQVQE